MLNNLEIDNIQIEILFLETTGAKSVEISIIPLLWPKRSLYQEFFSSFKMWRKKILLISMQQCSCTLGALRCETLKVK